MAKLIRAPSGFDALACKARCDGATSRTGMGFFDNATEVAIRLMPIFRRRRIDQFIGMVIHLAAALRADQFVFCHRVLLSVSVN
jgi:hypothetical protein